MHKAGVSTLPRSRPYSEVEAMFSLSVDLDNGRKKSIREYARIWDWSRKRVSNFLKSARHVNFREGATNGSTREPEEFTWINNLQRRGNQEGSHSGATTNETKTKTKRPVHRKQKNKPWSGLGKDLDRLLACDPYIQHLTAGSPVLAQWSFAEIRTWARSMVDKANQKRSQRNEKPISSPVHLLATCAVRVQRYERPTEVDPKRPSWLDEAADSMRAVK